MHCCCLSWPKYLTHTCNFSVVFTLFYCAQEKILSTVLLVSSQGSNPKMTAESNCRYEVEWVTEYACHRDYLESHSCKLSSEQHDMSIDLTPLTLSCKLSPPRIQWQIRASWVKSCGNTSHCVSVKWQCSFLVTVVTSQPIFMHGFYCFTLIILKHGKKQQCWITELQLCCRLFGVYWCSFSNVKIPTKTPPVGCVPHDLLFVLEPHIVEEDWCKHRHVVPSMLLLYEYNTAANRPGLYTEAFSVAFFQF